MPLCFIDPADAIRVVADSVGREARRQLLGEAVRAWVDEIPDDELEAHYSKAIRELDEHDISMLAAWHASMDIAHPIPNRDFLINAFGSLGQHRREALKLAAGFRGEEAVDRGLTEERALETVLEWLSPPARRNWPWRRWSSISGTAPAPTTDLAARERAGSASSSAHGPETVPALIGSPVRIGGEGRRSASSRGSAERSHRPALLITPLGRRWRLSRCWAARGQMRHFPTRWLKSASAGRPGSDWSLVGRPTDLGRIEDAIRRQNGPVHGGPTEGARNVTRRCGNRRREPPYRSDS